MCTRALALLAILLLLASLGPAAPLGREQERSPTPPCPKDARLATVPVLRTTAATAQPTPRWRTWDPAIAHAEYDGHLRNARRIRTGTIRRPETHHLVHMELQVRKLGSALEANGTLSAAERRLLRRTLGDAGQVIFFEQRRGRRPQFRPAVAERLGDGQLASAEAAELFAQFVRLAHVHRMLAGPPQARRKRAALEAEYAQLASQLFE